MKQEEIVCAAANRRTFLKSAGLAGLGIAGAAVLSTNFGSGQQKVEASSLNDTDILNFALNLEYLEAEFYVVSTYGATLVQLGVLSAADETGPTKGGKMVQGFGKLPEAYLASALRSDEITHVKFLRAALGSAAVKKPAINLDALGYGYANVNEFLKLARQFEDVGISAYLGAAPLITSKTYLAAAGAILAVESLHSGSIRNTCIMNGVISPAVDSMDVPPTPSKPYPVDANSLAIPRTTSQVLNIVYGGGKCAGGFFPDGLNGSIACQG